MKRVNNERVDGGSSIYARDVYYKTISLKSEIILGDKFWHTYDDDAISLLSLCLCV